MRTAATFSDCGRYRYDLTREWEPAKPRCVFVMLNPSTADATTDDPTLRRCVHYAKAWGFGAVEVVNLFAWRSTDPRVLKTVEDPMGPGNDAWLVAAADRADRIVCAWGNHGQLRGRGQSVRELLADRALWCWGLTKPGEPKHPLYLPRRATLVRLVVG